MTILEDIKKLSLPDKLIITGVPRGGKTTLAQALAKQDYKVLGSDSFITAGWSEGSQIVANALNNEGRWIYEGVALPRALRKWLITNAEGLPAYLFIFLSVPLKMLTPKQLSMAKGVLTVWNEILPEIVKRGGQVIIVE